MKTIFHTPVRMFEQRPCQFKNYTTYAVAFLVLAYVASLVDSSVVKRSSEEVTEESGGVTELTVHPKWRKREDDGAYFPLTPTTVQNKDVIEFSGSRVAFATSPPQLPPSEGVYSTSSRKRKPRKVNKRRKARRNMKKRRRNKKKKERLGRKRYRHSRKNKKSRRRRSHRNNQHSTETRLYSDHPISACASFSVWAQMNETRDISGNPVIVLPYIVMDGKRHIQYIYQTMCLDENQTCTGVDDSEYKSECKTKKTFTFAYVRNELGQESWSQVEVNGSCNCALYRTIRAGSRGTSILESIGIL